MNVVDIQKNFWKKSKEDTYFVCDPYHKDELNSVEEILGYKIPDSYRTLMMTRNGGFLKRPFFPLMNQQGKISRIFRCERLLGIANNDRNCLLGKHNNKSRKNGKTIGKYDFPMDGFQIGEWSPDSGWGNTYIYLDYSLCGKSGEPRVCAYEMKWSSTHTQALPIDHVIASSFSEFIDGLITKPIVAPFDFELLESKIINGSKVTLTKLLQTYSPSDISAFGLFTDDGSFISTSINTTNNCNIDSQYLTTEWTLEGTNDADIFTELTSQLEEHVALLVSEGEKRIFRNALFDCCTSALLKMKEHDFFMNVLGKEIILMVGTSHGDMPQARFNQIKKRLNPV